MCNDVCDDMCNVYEAMSDDDDAHGKDEDDDDDDDDVRM